MKLLATLSVGFSLLASCFGDNVYAEGKTVLIEVERYKSIAKDPNASDENAKQGGTLSKYSVKQDGVEVAKGYMLEAAGPDAKESGTDQRIPSGTYYVIKNPGSKGDFRLVLLDKVSASEQMGERSLINIHIGNFPKDIEGCLVPGTSASEMPYPKVNSSKLAYNKIRDLIQESSTSKKTTFDGAEEYKDSVLYDATIVIK